MRSPMAAGMTALETALGASVGLDIHLLDEHRIRGEARSDAVSVISPMCNLLAEGRDLIHIGPGTV